MTEQRVCKLCLKASNDLQAFEEITREILGVLLLKVNFSLNEDYVICESCADSINTFFKFKSAYLYTQDRTAPVINSMNGMEADIIETTCLEENSSVDSISNCDDAICRLCLKRGHCVDLNILNANFGEDIVATCIPEIDIKFSRDPKICLSCQTSLLNYYQFVTKCLAKQENTVECDDRGARLAIKSEELDIKMEEEECDSAIPSEDTEIKSFVDKSYKQDTNHTSINSHPNQNGHEIKMEYPEGYELIEDMVVTRYNCSHCPYVTKQKGNLSKHVLIHRKSLKTRTYNCNYCSYKAKHKSNLTQHMLIHKDPSEVTTYDCSFCSYKAKRRSHLMSHMLIHQDASEVATYDCSFCSYKSKRKGHLKLHMLIHKDASEITTYDCSFCSYKSKRKEHLKSHMLTHKDASEIMTFGCNFCSYKAKRKEHLTRHMLSHRDASKIIYQCTLCSYKTKWKEEVPGHMGIHNILPRQFQLNIYVHYNVDTRLVSNTL